MKIYKYRRIDKYIVDNILNSKFVYSRVGSFNDPFEISPKYKLVLDDYHKEYFSKRPNEYEKLLDNLNDQKIMSETINRLFVASFTEKKDDILMWSYYADSHRGICFEFDIPDEKLSEYILKDVKYYDNRVTIQIKLEKKVAEIEDEKNNINILVEDIRPLFFVKSRLWEHEKEFRMVFKDKELKYISSQYYPLFLPYLSHIYLGANVTEEDRIIVSSLANQVDVNVSRMIVDKQEFKMNSVPIPPFNKK